MEYTKVLYDEHKIILSAVEMVEKSEHLLNKNPKKWKDFCEKINHQMRHSQN